MRSCDRSSKGRVRGGRPVERYVAEADMTAIVGGSPVGVPKRSVTSLICMSAAAFEPVRIETAVAQREAEPHDFFCQLAKLTGLP